jgi:hypothetical protein
MTETKKPNLKAPRFRPASFNTLDKAALIKIQNSVPEARNLTLKQIRDIVLKFNEKVWEKVIDHRDGVDLPENMGNMFIGTCMPKIRKNVDFKTSTENEKVVQHRNWCSDDFLAKIFYTNFETKYRFKNHEIWGFKACRNFTRSVGRTYPENWKKYVQIDHTLKISKLFRKNSFKMIMKHKTEEDLSTYDEFALD